MRLCMTLENDRYVWRPEDIEELVSDSRLLRCLMEMQVHTWEGYDAAWEMFNDMEDANNDK